MMFANNIVKKANQIRKQNWSAPTVMSAFIICCMFMVYSFETIGILNKERNIDFRITSPETGKISFLFFLINFIVIKTYNMNGYTPVEKLEYNDTMVSEKLKNFSEKNREENLEKIRQIMMEGAMEQLLLESCAENKNVSEDENKIYEEKIDFFDI